MLRLVSPGLVLEVYPEHGAEIHSLIDRRTGDELLWRAPWQHDPFKAGSLPESEWMEQYRGGWQECFPNAGNACLFDGRYHGFHGEASNSPWDVLEVHEDSAHLRWSDGGLVLERKIWLSSSRAAIHYDERISNIGNTARSCIWLHHPSLGGPLLDPACIIDVPAGRAYPLDETNGPITPPEDAPLWPNVAGEDWSRASKHEQSLRFGCLTDLAAGWAALRNDVRGIGIALSWPDEIFLHLWLYQDIHGLEVEPWKRSGEFVMLEPATTPHSLGLATAVAHKQALVLAPGASRDSWFTVSLFRPHGPVRMVSRDGTVTHEM